MKTVWLIFLLYFPFFVMAQPTAPILNPDSSWISATFPASNGLNIPVNTTFSVTFNRDMDPTSLAAGTIFALSGSQGALALGNFHYDISGRILTFHTPQLVAGGDRITVILGAGIRSAAGDNPPFTFQFSFTTGLNSPENGIFYPPLLQPIGMPAVVLDRADLDGDGDAELIAGERRDSTYQLSVYAWEDSSKTFAETFSAPLPAYPFALTTGDFDRDGLVDLVAGVNAQWDSGHVVIFHNQGNGQFLEVANLTTERELKAVETGDLNGDGYPDLVTSNYAGIHVRLNDGSGHYPESYLGLMSRSESVALADLDGDGDLDIAGARGNDREEIVLLMNEAGSGSAFAFHTLPTGENPMNILANDLDGDGNPDLAAVVGGKLAILSNSGDGISYTIDLYTEVGTVLDKLLLADFDGDGDQDLFVHDDFRAFFYVNDGQGILTRDKYVSLGAYSTEAFTTSAGGDWDGDGDWDIALGSRWTGQLFTLLNEPYAKMEMTPTLLDFGRIDPGQNATLSVKIKNSGEGRALVIDGVIQGGSSAFHLTPPPGSIAPGDSAFMQVSFLPGEARIYRDSIRFDANAFNQDEVRMGLIGRGNFINLLEPAPNSGARPLSTSIAVGLNFPLDPQSLSDSTFQMRGSISGTIPGNLNYDPSQDHITFAPHSALEMGETITATLTGALRQNSGDPIPYPFSWQFGVAATGGTGGFAAGDTIEFGNRSRRGVNGDFNGDGFLDLLIPGPASNGISLIAGRPSGGFLPPVASGLWHSPSALAAADFDGDGDLDFVTVSGFTNDLFLGLNDGAGQFTGSLVFDFDPDFSPNQVVCYDFDSDGDQDLAVGGVLERDNTRVETVVFCANQGTAFSRLSMDILDANNQLSYVHNMQVADLEGDGVLELVIWGVTSAYVVRQPGLAGAQALYSIYRNGQAAGTLLDLDDDGDLVPVRVTAVHRS
nr:FG-GAP-like repeat-containing protein [Calditrichia bacterium]